MFPLDPTILVKHILHFVHYSCVHDTILEHIFRGTAFENVYIEIYIEYILAATHTYLLNKDPLDFDIFMNSLGSESKLASHSLYDTKDID